MTRFLRIQILLAATTALAASAASQEANRAFVQNAIGYGYFSGGKCIHEFTVLGVGGGGEKFLWRGLTLGVDGGYHHFVDDLNFSLVLLNIRYHFAASGRTDFFVTVAPAGAYFQGGSGYAISFGAGLDYWFKERLGVRTEALIQGLSNDEGLNSLRVGVTFR